MSDIITFFSLGFSKIAFLGVFIHSLLIVALCGIYSAKAFRIAGLLGICFFSGFAITFHLSTFDFIYFPQQPLIFILPITIFIVAVTNFFMKKNAFINRYPSQGYRYYLALFFGAIHGLAYPDLLKTLLDEEAVFLQMFSFNLGIITALGLIVMFLLTTAFFLTFFLRVHIREWNLILSGGCAGTAVYMIASSLIN
ncbi:MAG: HupE/UreJ family protein [Cytophagaceae bacterium]